MDILALLLAVIVETFMNTIAYKCDNDSNNGINHNNMNKNNNTRKRNSNSKRNRNSSNNNSE